MHFGTTFLTLNDRTVIALNAELTFFDLITIAGRVIATNVQFAFWIDQVAVHRCAAFLTAAFGAQCVGLRIVTFQHVENFVLRHEVDSGFATLFRRQRITRATEEHARGRGTDPHFTATGWAVDARQYHLVRQHAALFRIFLGFLKLIGKIAEEAVENFLPLCLMAGNLIEAVFHLRGEVIVHQLAEVRFQTVGDNLPHFFSIETTVLNANVSTILNGRND